ncbi:MAG: GNAT family N-acetyltransferase [Myxococcaceae bacterium]
MSQSLPTQLKVHRAISEIPEAAWNALVDEESAPFLEWRWLEALEWSGSVSEASGWEPRHLALWRGHRLVAAAPAYVKSDSSGEFVFDFAWATASERAGVPYYPKLVIAAPLTPAMGRRFLVAPGEDLGARTLELAGGALELAREEGLSSVHVLFPTEVEALALEPLGFAVRQGVQYHFLNEGYRAPEDVLQRFTSKRRNQLRRERRAPAQQGLEIRVLRGEALAEADPKEAFRLYARTVDKFAWGRRYLNPRFFSRVLDLFRHRVELVQARAGDRVVAGAFNVAGDRVLYGRYWGCFEEHPFLHFNVCLYAGMDEVVRRGLLRFEPGAGGEHKLVRGFTPSLTYSAHALFHRGLDRAVREFLTHERAAIQAGIPSWRAETGFKD